MDDRSRARQAVRDEMARREMSNAELSRLTGLDIGTVSDFLAGGRWPRTSSLAKIDDALGWVTGSIDRIGQGLPGPDVRPDAHDPVEGVLLDISPDAYGDLTPAEREEADAAAKAYWLSKAREIRRAREG